MNIQNITVPKGIRYLSDWDGYDLRAFPFPHILDKVLTGCGFTEYCLKNSQNLILCSPRKLLLKNKEDQHPGELFYFKNELKKVGVEYDRQFSLKDSVEGIHSREYFEKKNKDNDSKEVQDNIIYYKSKVKDYYDSCLYEGGGKPCKIIVTYDSFRHVKEALIEKLGKDRFKEEFQVVIDEWQSIFIDSKFKPDTEFELLGHLKGLTKICFASATPMMDKYLDMLDEFKNLPYYRLDWETEDPNRIISPVVTVKETRSITEELNRVIQSYLGGRFKEYAYRAEDGTIQKIVSNECVLYVNSVKHICQAIKSNHLLPYQCNVLCAKTTDNEKKIRRAFKSVIEFYKENPSSTVDKKLLTVPSPCLGDIPKLREPHKMFTFCTRTVYLGADFYSRCAQSFIFSDSNIDCLTIDIALDLPQILGRQRLEANPWKNNASIFVLKTRQKLTQEEFEKRIKKKIELTKAGLSIWEKTKKESEGLECQVLLDKFSDSIFIRHYAKDYISLNYHDGSAIKPGFNHLVEISERRAFDVQQLEYQDWVSIYNTITNSGCLKIDINKELSQFNSYTTFEEKLRYACELYSTLPEEKFVLFINSVPKDYSNFIFYLTPDVCAAFSYRGSLLREQLNKIINNQGKQESVEDKVLEFFKVGERYTKSFIKEKLREIYEECNYQKTPKASDLETWFEIKTCQIVNKETKKKDHSFLIVSVK